MDDLFELTHYPDQLLGNLEPKAPGGEVARDGEMVVNGVRIPRIVVEQLMRRGEPLSAYSPGELQAADLAAVVDCKVIHDPYGPDFMDDLKSRTDEDCEVDDDDDDVPPEPWRMDEHIKSPIHHVDGPISPWESFSDQLSCRQHRATSALDCDTK